MSENDFLRIERELNLRLPKDYRELMLNYPFSKDSLSADDLLPNDPEVLITHNQVSDLHSLMAMSSNPSVPLGNYFSIGSDSSEESYWIDVTSPKSPVYKFALECCDLTIKAANLEEYVKQCWHIEEEIKKDEEYMSRRRWWQFWR